MPHFVWQALAVLIIIIAVVILLRFLFGFA